MQPHFKSSDGGTKLSKCLNCSIKGRAWDRNGLQGRGTWTEMGQLAKVIRIQVRKRAGVKTGFNQD
jgi:hypothetical protein